MNTKKDKLSSQKIGQVLARARKMAGYSQTEIAEKLGVSQRTVSAYEKGMRRIHAGQLFKFASIINISLDEIADTDLPELDRRTKEAHILKKLKRLSENDKNAVRTMIDSLAEKQTV